MLQPPGSKTALFTVPVPPTFPMEENFHPNSGIAMLKRNRGIF
jgi:hypothetical protein